MSDLRKEHTLTEKIILEAIKGGDRDVFGVIYDKYASELLQFIYGFTKDKEVSEDILQEILVTIWNRRTTIEINGTLKNYLYGAARYAVLSYIRSEKVKQKYANHFHLFLSQHSWNQTNELVDLNDLHTIISLCMEKLPPKCKEAFYLSRFQHRSIQEIAADMGISSRTVENYITTGIKTIKHALRNYTWLLLLFNQWIR